jgi:hypothetical protein
MEELQGITSVSCTWKNQLRQCGLKQLTFPRAVGHSKCFPVDKADHGSSNLHTNQKHDMKILGEEYGLNDGCAKKDDYEEKSFPQIHIGVVFSLNK